MLTPRSIASVEQRLFHSCEGLMCESLESWPSSLFLFATNLCLLVDQISGDRQISISPVCRNSAMPLLNCLSRLTVFANQFSISGCNSLSYHQFLSCSYFFFITVKPVVFAYCATQVRLASRSPSIVRYVRRSQRFPTANY